MSKRNSNDRRRKGPGKTILAILLAIADIVLLAVIICGIIDSNYESEKEYAKEAGPATEVNFVEESEAVKVEEPEELKEPEEPEESEETEEPEEPEETGEPEEPKEPEDVEEPSLSDFMWYFDGVYWNGVPENSSRISDSSYLSGNWKIFIWFDHEKDSDTYWIEFGNVNLDFSDDNVNIVVNPCKLYPPSGAEPIDLSNSGTDQYNGKFDGNELNATGAGNFHITNFYTLNDGKQYAVGSIDEPDGTPTVIALVRLY